MAGALAVPSVRADEHLDALVGCLAAHSATWSITRSAAFGPKVFNGETALLQPGGAGKTHAFYEKHGGKTLVISRFLPLFRTFALSLPALARPTPKFSFFNLIGAAAWVFSLCIGGYLLGSLPWIKAEPVAAHRRHHSRFADCR